jgi:hypothetical protein
MIFSRSAVSYQHLHVRPCQLAHKLWWSPFAKVARQSHSVTRAKTTSSSGQKSHLVTFLLAAGVATLTVDSIKNSSTTSSSTTFGNNFHRRVTQCAAPYDKKNSAILAKTGGDVVMLGATKEKATGILFPNLCNAMTFVGCGVRVKYGFVKVRRPCVYVCVCVSPFLSDVSVIHSSLHDTS